MKKLIPLVLALLMALSLVACGEQTNTEENGTASEPTASVTSDDAEPGSGEKNTESPEVPESSAAPEQTPAFDTAWAGENYVMPIPAPPVSDFKISEMIGSSGGKAVQVSALDVQGLTDDEVVAYRKTLESLGFVNGIYESGFDSRQGYEFSAKNGNGDTVYINCNRSSEYFILIFEFAK